MVKDKEISLILLKDFVFFPGKFLGGTMGQRVLVLNPGEDIWKVFLWTWKFRKKPCRVVFESDTFRKATLGYATEIKKSLGGDLIYSTKLDEDSYIKILEKWESTKRVREEDD